jgi:hypothetical protein
VLSFLIFRGGNSILHFGQVPNWRIATKAQLSRQPPEAGFPRE